MWLIFCLIDAFVPHRVRVTAELCGNTIELYNDTLVIQISMFIAKV